jgi:hypothetical protein
MFVYILDLLFFPLLFDLFNISTLESLLVSVVFYAFCFN